MSYSIPSELNYSTLSRMYPSTKSQLRKAPFNGAIFNQGSLIQIQIPRMDRAFLNPATSALNYSVRFNFSTAGTAAAVGDSKLIMLGTAWSPFRRYTSQQQGGQSIDQIDAVNLIVNSLLNMTMNTAERNANVGLGFNETNPLSNIAQEWLIAAASNTASAHSSSMSFSIPFLGALGSSSQMIPLTSDLELNLTLDNVSNYMISVGNGTLINVEISSVEFVSDVLTLENQGYQELLSQNPNGFSLKSQSFSYSSGVPLSGAFSGSQDITIPFSLNSLKQVIWWASPTDAWDRSYGGVNPNLASYNLVIGSTSYPNLPVKCQSVSELFYNNQVAFGAFQSSNHTGACPRSTIRSSTANGEFPQYTFGAVSYANSLVTSANKCYFALDLETINQMKSSLYSGISTRGSTNTLRLNVANSLKSSFSMNIHIVACYDVVLNFDYNQGVVTYST